MDPDHPLAALIRKTQQERNGAAAAAAAIMATKPEEVPAEPAVPATPAEYIADREYSFSFLRVELGNCEIQYPTSIHISAEGASSFQFSPGPLHFSPHFFYFPLNASSVSQTGRVALNCLVLSTELLEAKRTVHLLEFSMFNKRWR